MPDIGGLEMLVIAVVALIVLGPRDLTRLFRTLGEWTGRMRGMAREFSRAMNDAAGDTGLNEISRDLRNITNPKKMGLDALNKAVEDIDPTKYPEGSETRKLAEKRAAAQAETRRKIEERRNAAATPPAGDAAEPETAASEPAAEGSEPRTAAGDA